MSDKSRTLGGDLTVGPILPQLIRFAIPFVISNALQTVYAMVDMIVVGQFCDSAGVTAVSIGGQITWLLTALAVGFSSGAQVLIAQLMGIHDQQGMRRTIGTVFTSVTVLALLFTALGVGFAKPLIHVMNTPEEAVSDALDYLIICSAGMFFIYGYNVVSAILRGMGDSKRPLYFIAIASISNLVLDLVFVAGFHWGTAGAAAATVIGQAISFIISLIYLYRRQDSFGFDFKLKSFAVDQEKLKLLLKIGLPMALQMSAINISFMFITAYVNTYGLTSATLFSIGNRISNLAFIVTGSMQTAGATLVGQNYAAGKLDRIRSFFWIDTAICGVFLLLLCVLVVAHPRWLFGWFTTDEAVLAMAPGYSWVLVCFFVTFATMNASMALITGQGYALLNFVIAMMDGVVGRIALSLVLAYVFDLGLYGLFWGNALAGFISVIWGDIYYFSGRWKRRKTLVG